jgi:hypothetical protein
MRYKRGKRFSAVSYKHDSQAEQNSDPCMYNVSPADGFEGAHFKTVWAKVENVRGETNPRAVTQADMIPAELYMYIYVASKAILLQSNHRC